MTPDEKAKEMRDMEAAAEARIRAPAATNAMSSLSIDRTRKTGAPVPFGTCVPRIKKWD